MRLVLVSDTHGRHAELTLPEGDVVVHAGDFSMLGREDEVRRFLAWFGDLPHPGKVLVAGNHDFLAEQAPERFRALIPDGVTYLEDETAEVAGLRVFGSPITPWFHDWAFNRARGAEIASYWARIPPDTDLLVTHGPPHGILDCTTQGELVGCEELASRVRTIRPRWHVFGHIHEARGELQEGGVHYVNACSLDRQYALRHAPITIDA